MSGNPVKKVGKVFEDAIDDVEDFLEDTVDAVGDGIEDAGQFVGDAAEDLYDVAENGVQNFIDLNRAGFELATGDFEQAMDYFGRTTPGKLIGGVGDMFMGTSKKIANENRLAKEAAERSKRLAENQSALGKAQAEGGKVITGKRGRKRASGSSSSASAGAINVSPSTGIQR